MILPTYVHSSSATHPQSTRTVGHQAICRRWPFFWWDGSCGCCRGPLIREYSSRGVLLRLVHVQRRRGSAIKARCDHDGGHDRGRGFDRIGAL